MLAVEDRSPRLRRVTLTGPELDGFLVELPAASARLLLPEPGAELVVPTWNGNEFLLPDGRRPTIRTLTPWSFGGFLAVDVVLHGSGRASTWAQAAAAGDGVALSGPGRGYAVDPGAPGYFLAGDETALPAVSQLLTAIPATTPVQVHLEMGDDSARLPLPEHSHAVVDWHVLPAGATPGDAMVDAVRGATFGDDFKVWAAGEAAAVQRVRKHLFDERGLARSQCTVRGYWKHGRSGDDGGAGQD